MTQEGGGVIYAELGYKINGLLFEAHNSVGRYCNEQQVCDAIEHFLKRDKILYKREFVLPPSFEGEMKGRNRVDFLVEDVIILEIKCKRFLTKEDYYQAQRYLHALNRKLAILVNFRDERIKPRRILNPQFKIQII